MLKKQKEAWEKTENERKSRELAEKMAAEGDMDEETRVNPAFWLRAWRAWQGMVGTETECGATSVLLKKRREREEERRRAGWRRMRRQESCWRSYRSEIADPE